MYGFYKVWEILSVSTATILCVSYTTVCYLPLEIWVFSLFLIIQFLQWILQNLQCTAAFWQDWQTWQYCQTLNVISFPISRDVAVTILPFSDIICWNRFHFYRKFHNRDIENPSHLLSCPKNAIVSDFSGDIRFKICCCILQCKCSSL
jgi:hypothetical protein